MGNCPRGEGGEQLLRGNHSGVIVCGAKLRGVIVLGGFHWGGAKVRGVIVLAGISWEAVVREGSCPKGN